MVNWERVDREDYLLTMERSPVKDIEIKALLKKALTNEIDSRQIYMKSIDASYRYEGYTAYTMKEISRQ